MTAYRICPRCRRINCVTALLGAYVWPLDDDEPLLAGDCRCGNTLSVPLHIVSLDEFAELGLDVTADGLLVA